MRARISAVTGVGRAVPWTSSTPPPGRVALAVSRAAERPVASRPSATSRSLSISKRVDWPGRGSNTVARPLTSTRATRRPSGDLPLVSAKVSAGTVTSEVSTPRRRTTRLSIRAWPSSPTPPCASMAASNAAPITARSSATAVSGGR